MSTIYFCLLGQGNKKAQIGFNLVKPQFFAIQNPGCLKHKPGLSAVTPSVAAPVPALFRSN